ncbi:MAG: hypothetical protein ACKVRO_07460 [Micropepsaceae bacterium]
MSEKPSLAQRSVTAVVKVAERADVAWTTMMVVNTVFVWSAGAMSLIGLMPPANDAAAAMTVVPSGVTAPSAPAPLPREVELLPGVEVSAADADAPARAVWSYLCNRDALIGQAANAPCPEHNFTKGDLLTLGPLKRDEGDAVYGRRKVTIEMLLQESEQ